MSAVGDIGKRRLVPELLDSLPAADPRALASRRDLVRINALMLQSRITSRLMRRYCESKPARILELGAGDGRSALAVARRLAPHWRGVSLVLLDFKDSVPAGRREQIEALGWRLELVTADVFDWLEHSAGERFGAVTANLFLHHFEDAPLARLLAGVARLAPVFVATEPRRGTLPLAASRLLWAIGANDVTRHDAPASVRAGFDGSELAALWPERERWRIEEGPAALFTHAFAARRVSP